MEEYIYTIKYYLGIIEKKDLINWADNKINEGNYNQAFFELSLSNSKSKNEIVYILNKLCSNTIINNQETKKIFYDIFKKDINNITVLERKLLDFHEITKDKLNFTENEKISFSIIENDLSLREEKLPNQLNKLDLINFLNNGYI